MNDLTLPEFMQAWLCRRYGAPDVLQLERVALPKVGPNTVLIRMLATTASSADARIRGCRFPPGMALMGRLALGWNAPRRPVLGSELVGEVVAIGAEVTRFSLGQRVIAFPDMAIGAHAEYVAMKQDGCLVSCPPELPPEHAASLAFGGLTVLHYMRKANLLAGERVLVLGASGAVGSAMVQIARAAGAQVDAVCSAANAAQVTALGAQRVFDYTREDFHQSGERWDVIADCIAASDFGSVLNVLRPGGRYLAIAGGLKDMLALPRKGRRSISGPASSSRDNLSSLVEMAMSGAFVPVIDSVLPFASLPEGHRIADSGRKRGSVVVVGL